MTNNLKIFFVRPKGGKFRREKAVFAESKNEVEGIMEISCKDYEIREGNKLDEYLNFMQRRKSKESDFTLNFKKVARLLRAKTSLDKAISLQKRGMKNIFSKYVCFKIAELLKKGIPLHEAFGNFPEIFSSGLIAMLKSAEKSGELEAVFDNIGHMERKKHILIGKVGGELIYPIIMLLISMAMAVSFSLFVLPKVKEMYEGHGIALPTLTSILLQTVMFVKAHPPILLIIPIGLIVAWVRRRHLGGSNKLQAIFYGIPKMGTFMWKKDFILVLQHLSMLLVAKIPVKDAIENASDVTKNNGIRRIFRGMSLDLRKGKSISEIFENFAPKFKIDGSEVANIIEIGEETGELESLLKLYALESAEEMELELNNFGKLLKPLMTIMMSGVALLIIMTIGYPIMNLTYSVMQHIGS